MFIKVNGQQVEVGVSEGGTFYDKATRKHTAKTLKGLEKKMREANQPTGGIPVERSDGKAGTCVGRVGGRSYQRHYFRINWSDNTQTNEWGGGLRIPMTPEQRAKEAKLDAAVDAAQKAAQKARDARDEYLEQFGIKEHLESAYPMD